MQRVAEAHETELRATETPFVVVLVVHFFPFQGKNWPLDDTVRQNLLEKQDTADSDVAAGGLLNEDQLVPLKMETELSEDTAMQNVDVAHEIATGFDRPVTPRVFQVLPLDLYDSPSLATA